MNRILEVCLFAATFATSVTSVSHAQSPALQKGISVELAATSHAAPMPEADDQEAWLVAVTADGKLYFGTNSVTGDGLVNEMIRTPRKREQKLYIKADDRAPFSDVEKVLEAGRTVYFNAAVLLTSQAEPAAPGAIVSPKGLDVSLESSSSSGSVVVQLKSGQPSPTLRVNDRQVAPATLENMLRQLLQNQSEKAVLVQADEQVPFGEVVHVIDVCRSTGAKCVLPTPQL